MSVDWKALAALATTLVTNAGQYAWNAQGAEQAERMSAAHTEVLRGFAEERLEDLRACRARLEECLGQDESRP